MGNHDYMEFNGNSSTDYVQMSSRGETTDEWDNERSMDMSASDNDDFNNSGFEDENKAWTDKRSPDSRTFNEDEQSWKEKKDMGNSSDDAGAGAGYGSHTSNRGTSNNNWDANDQMQRGRERHGDDEEGNSLF